MHCVTYVRLCDNLAAIIYTSVTFDKTSFFNKPFYSTLREKFMMTRSLGDRVCNNLVE